MRKAAQKRPKTPKPSNITVTLRDPHIHQQKFLESTAKRRIIRAGRRGGKTVGAAIAGVEAFLGGKRVLYAAPTQDQVGAFWYEVKRALADTIDSGLFCKNESTHVIEHDRTRARIRAKTAWNADTLRGDYADVLILDEFQLMNEDTWELVGAPMLLDNDGSAIFIYTPPSLRSAFISKARNPRHASELYNRAKTDTTGRWECFHFTSHDNPFLSVDALQEIREDMTALAYRQEIMAEDVEEAPGALWRREWIDTYRVRELPEGVTATYTVVAVDPSASSTGDACGIVVACAADNGHFYVLGDETRQGLPSEWVHAALTVLDKYKGDRIVYESNQGGEMVRTLFRMQRPDIAITGLPATRSKQARAEPISVMTEKGIVHHVGDLPRLEDELCLWIPGSSESPNRLDAFVWAISYLRKHAAPKAVRVYR